MKKKALNFKPVWLVAPAIVVVWMLIMYFCKEVFPFGSASIIDNDLHYGGVPAWHHIYDAWRSGNISDLFYDFTTAGGFSWNSVMSILHPRNLFLLMWPRENFADAVSIFFIVELASIALSASYSFSKLFPKLSNNWLVLIALMYSFCGYNLIFYTNMDWLDTVLIYPLLIMFTLNLFKGKSKIPFFAILSYLLLFGTYMAFFVMLSLIIFGGLYLFIVEEKSNRKNAVLSLGIAAGVSLLAGASCVYNFASGIFGSARLEQGSYSLDSVSGQQEKISGYWGLLNSENQIDIIAVFMFMGMALAIVSLIVLWVHFKKHKESRKYTIFFTITLALLAAQILFKSVMLIWHAGSYQMFPFRNGYMVAFFCCCIIGYYYSEFEGLEGVELKNPVLNFLTVIPCLAAGLMAAGYVGVYYSTLTSIFDILSVTVTLQTNMIKYPYMCLSLALIACLLFIKFIKIKNVRRVFSMGLVLAMIGLNSFILIGCKTDFKDEVIYAKEKSVGEHIEVEDVLCRVNNDDRTLITNYGYVSGVPAIANWTHSLSATHLKAFSDLGFNTHFTFVTGVGGTVFAEALMRVTKTTAEVELNKELYEKFEESDLGIKFYNNKYTLPVGLVFDKEIKDISADDYKNTFEYQNALYESLADDNTLFNKVSCTDVSEKIEKEKVYFNREKSDGTGNELRCEEKNICTSTYIIDVKEKSVLYLHGSEENDSCYFTELKVNGKLYHVFDGESVSEDGKTFNTAYPDTYNNGPLELGVFENETVEISIKFAPDKETTDSVVFYSMDLGKLESLCAESRDDDYTVEGNKISFKAVGEQGDVVFVPVTYDKNWECTVNGESVEIVCIMGNFIGVEITDAENDVVLNFSNDSAYFSIVMVVSGFVLGLVLLLVEKRIKIPKQIYILALIAFAVIFAVAMVVIYALPIGYSVVNEITALIK